MKKIILLICLTLIAVPKSQSQSFQTPKNFGNLYYQEQGNDIVSDKCGNIYTVGTISGTFTTTVAFDNVIVQNSSGNGSDLVVTKHDANGNTIWVKQAGGVGNQIKTVGYSIVADDSCNIYVAGSWNYGSIAFEGDSLNGTSGSFLAKLDSSGTIIWIRQNNALVVFPGNLGIVLSDDGMIYMTGQFTNTVSFGGPGSLTSIGATDIFLAKYTTGGVFKWAKRFGGINYDYGIGVSVDNSGNVYCAGNFKGTVTFGSTTLVSAGAQDIYTMKCDSSGAVIWAAQYGASYDESVEDMVTDDAGNVFIGGGTAENALFIKYSNTGALNWSYETSTTANFSTVCYGVAIDHNGYVFFTGTHHNDVIIGTQSFPTGAFFDVFVAKYSVAGQFSWARKYESPYGDKGHQMAFVNTDMFVTGQVSESSATATSNYMLIKLTGATVDISEQELLNGIRVFPSPTNGKFRITLQKNGSAKVTVADLLGHCIYTNEKYSDNSEIDLSANKAGVYCITVETSGTIFAGKVVLQE